MGTELAYFYDTYALYELLRGNPAYLSYGNRTGFFTTDLNLLELYYRFLDVYDEKRANECFESFKPFTTPILPETLKHAARFRHANKKLKMSYVDCIGYVMALERGIKFLTGDKAFENMPNVEFVR